jgi:hypothetical protein
MVIVGVLGLLLLIGAARSWPWHNAAASLDSLPGSSAPQGPDSAGPGQPAATGAGAPAGGHTHPGGQPTQGTRQPDTGPSSAPSPGAGSPPHTNRPPNPSANPLLPAPTYTTGQPNSSPTTTPTSPAPPPPPHPQTTPPAPPPVHTLVIHISHYSDATAAGYGVEVRIHGVNQPTCKGVNSSCAYQVHDGDSVTLLDQPWEFPYVKVYSWGSGSCASAPHEGPCHFTASGDAGFNLLLQPFA